MHFGFKATVAVGFVLALAACTPSPKQQLAADCKKGGNSAETCKCFVDELGKQLNDKQMAVLAKSTKNGAQRYADDLAFQFPKRRFVVECHPHDFAYTVRVYKDDKPVAYAGARKWFTPRQRLGS